MSSFLRENLVYYAVVILSLYCCGMFMKARILCVQIQAFIEGCFDYL